MELISSVITIIILELILGVDNAAAIAALVKNLPTDPIELPSWAKWINGRLRTQQDVAWFAGLLLAYAGRVVVLLLARFLIQYPIFFYIGALYLFLLGAEYLSKGETVAEENEFTIIRIDSLKEVIGKLFLMDLMFSLDSVVAAVAVTSHQGALIGGVFIGMLGVWIAAKVIAGYIEKNPAVKTAAFLMVLNISIIMFIKAKWHIHISEVVQFGIQFTTVICTLIYAKYKKLHVVQPFFTWLAQGLGNLYELIMWVFVPFKAAGRLAMASVSKKRNAPAPAD